MDAIEDATPELCTGIKHDELDPGEYYLGVLNDIDPYTWGNDWEDIYKLLVLHANSGDARANMQLMANGVQLNYDAIWQKIYEDAQRFRNMSTMDHMSAVRVARKRRRNRN